MGDRCLALRLTGEGLARALPGAQAGQGFDTRVFAPHAPLPAEVMLLRGFLFARLRQGDCEGLEAEERGLHLQRATLAAVRHEPARRRTGKGNNARRVRHVRCT